MNITRKDGRATARSEQVRDLLRGRTAENPMLGTDIRKVIPNDRVYNTICAMLRDGQIARSGERGQYAYWLVRETICRKRYTAEELKQHKRERERVYGRRRRAAAGIMSAQERFAVRRKEAEARAAQKAADKAAAKEARKATREAARVARAAAAAEERQKAADAKKAAERRKAKARAQPAVLMSEARRVAATLATPQYETVDDFLRRGGRIQTLPGVGHGLAP